MASTNQDHLRAFFESASSDTYSTHWETLWKDGTFLPWDRGYANPALIDLLACSPPPVSDTANPSLGAPSTPWMQDTQLPSALKDDGSRARVLVPGCGKGYDLALFAAWGYDAYGLEISETAAGAAQRYLEDPGEGSLEGEYRVRDAKAGRGSTRVVTGDYFQEDWLKEVGGGERGFDIIYDNTVCQCECIVACTDWLCSSCVPSPSTSDLGGQAVLPLSFPPPACLSASSFQPINRLQLAVRHGRCLPQSTLSSSNGPARRYNTMTSTW